MGALSAVLQWRQKLEHELSRHLELPVLHLELLLSAFLSGQHVMLEGPPGSGKTTLAKLFAEIHGGYRRVQMNSELLPSDIIGAEVLVSQQPVQFEFRRGPLFSKILFLDEINRANPRAQAALLQAMSENGVEVQGRVLDLDPDFFVLATQNAEDFEGTFLLPDSQWDRFGLLLRFNHGRGEALARRLTLACGRGASGDHLSSLVLQKPVWSGLELSPEWTRVCVCLQDTLSKEPGGKTLSIRSWRSWITLGAALSALRGKTHLSTSCLRDSLVPCLGHRMGELGDLELADRLLSAFDRQTSG